MIEGDKLFPIAVIGGGSAGVMATMRGVLNNDEVLLLPGSGKDKKKSRAMWVSKIENMPGHFQYKKGIDEPNREALNFLANGDFKEKFHWKKNRSAAAIVKNGDHFDITDDKGESYKALNVILCTGVMDVQPEVNGSIESIFPYANDQLIDYCIRCDGHHVLGKRVAVIGHTNGAAWVGIILHERYNVPEMTIMTHGESPEFDEPTQKILKGYGINVRTETIEGFIGNAKEGEFKGFQLEGGKTFDTEFAFVSLGMIVYNQLAKDLGANVDDRGFVLTNEKGETNIDGLYVAGDLRAGFKKQIYTAWDTAVDSADDINSKLRRKRREDFFSNK